MGSSLHWGRVTDLHVNVVQRCQDSESSTVSVGNNVLIYLSIFKIQPINTTFGGIQISIFI